MVLQRGPSKHEAFLPPTQASAKSTYSPSFFNDGGRRLLPLCSTFRDLQRPVEISLSNR